jgi:hypothetical protein
MRFINIYSKQVTGHHALKACLLLALQNNYHSCKVDKYIIDRFGGIMLDAG